MINICQLACIKQKSWNYTLCSDKWRFGKHLLYPAFCLLKHHADTKDTTRICLDNAEHSKKGGRKPPWNIATSIAILEPSFHIVNACCCRWGAGAFPDPKALAGGFIYHGRKMHNSKWKSPSPDKLKQMKQNFILWLSTREPLLSLQRVRLHPFVPYYQTL